VESALAVLVVDLDGTLTPIDTLVESVLQLVKQRPAALFSLPRALLGGRAAFKHWVAQQAGLDVDQLPWNTEFIEYLQLEHSRGRRIVLATAAHRGIAEAVFRRFAFFDDLLCSDREINLKGRYKLEAIQRLVGDHFIYAGDSGADLAVWRGAAAAILVGASSTTTAATRKLTRIEREFEHPAQSLQDWLRLLRVHQWLKNVLLFVPLLTAFSFFESQKWLAAGFAFIAFSIAASGTYILNDLWDLRADRAHPRKKFRPLASGRLQIVPAFAMSLLMIACSIGLAAVVSKGYLLALLCYLMLTVTYSWVLKYYVLLDVIILSTLYTLRIVAGALAVEVVVSSWLLAFSMFIFLSLALVKRCAELVSSEQDGRRAAYGRDYRVSDLVVLWPLGVGASLAAVVVFGLFISAPETTALYASPALLWLVAGAMIYWLARLWIKTCRSEMHDDPVVYAVKNSGSRLTIFGMVAAVIVARFLDVGL
jgi:4-hydroxybenzoate polyprenyltransferase